MNPVWNEELNGKLIYQWRILLQAMFDDAQDENPYGRHGHLQLRVIFLILPLAIWKSYSTSQVYVVGEYGTYQIHQLSKTWMSFD